MAEVYQDHNVPAEAADFLRRSGHSVRTAANIGKARATDDEHFLLAAQNGWLLVTSNARDFVLLHDAWHRWGRHWGIAQAHGGVLIVDANWRANRIAGEVAGFLAAGLPSANHLYTHHAGRGWVSRPWP